jgi:hypothetical protein
MKMPTSALSMSTSYAPLFGSKQLCTIFQQKKYTIFLLKQRNGDALE